MGSSYNGPAAVIADDATYAVAVHLSGLRDRQLIGGEVVEGLRSWSGRLTAGTVDEWQCAHAAAVWLELPDGRRGQIIFDKHPRFTGSGEAPFDF